MLTLLDSIKYLHSALTQYINIKSQYKLLYQNNARIGYVYA